jgi:uncharacterized delta-60 repeat protein
MRRFFKLLLLLAAMHCFHSSLAQNYVLDRNFGQCGEGYAELSFDKTYTLVATHVLPNGKMLTVGNGQTDSGRVYLILVQRLRNGRMDSAFGTNGVVEHQFNFQSFAYGSLLEQNGKIILAGYENDSTTAEGRIPSLYRFNSNGSLDSTFSDDAVFAELYDGLSSGYLEKAMRWNSTHLIAAGISFKNNNTGFNGIGVIKVNNTGVLDNNFGNLAGFPGRSGIVIDSVSDVHVFAQSNQIIISFLHYHDSTNTIMLARLNGNGTIDNGFGVNGILNTGVISEGLAAIQLTNGKLLLGGTVKEPGQPKRMQVIRYLSNLTPDPSFGTNGRVIIPSIGNNRNNFLDNLLEWRNGNIFILGHTLPIGSIFNGRPVVLRLLENGDFDSSFNGTGNMQPGFEQPLGWTGIDTTDSVSFIMGHSPDFRLVRFVPDTTNFNLATADFQYTIERLRVYFENKSPNANSYFWGFGDNTFSDQVNPSHEYALPGVYEVMLESAGVCSGGDTTKTIKVKGIYKITPDMAADKGFVVCHIYGYGFDSTSLVVLKKGSTTLTASQVFFDTASHSLQVNFQFTGAPLGKYDVIVTTASRNDTLPQSFDIQQRDIGKPWVQIVGPYKRSWRTLTGERINTYRLEYGFTGNATQYLIPLGLVIRGTVLKPDIITPVANLSDTANLPASLKPLVNGFYHRYDSISRDSVWVFRFYDRVVEPNVTHSFEFTITTTTLLGDFGIRGYIGHTLFDREQADTLNGLARTTLNDCDNYCIKCILDLAGFIPGPLGCAASILSLGCSIYNFQITPLTTVGDIISLGIAFASAGVSCGTMTGTAFGEVIKLIEANILGYALQAQSVGGAFSDCAAALAGLATTGSCGGPGGSASGNYPRKGSFDPNIKIGPASYNKTHYINIKEPLTYTTEFENLSTATAPAFRAIVTDTIDKSVLDISSFRFTGIRIADVDYPNFTEKNSFAMDIPMPGKGITVRVNGKVDTATGIVTWKFTSLDSVTMELIENETRGFLPPNIDSISGKGAVLFSVEQKSTNTHLTSIFNKAFIVFDYNAPIITPIWTNIVDTVKPQSQVHNQFHVLTDSTFSVRWSGFDANAGIRTYNIYISENDSAYFLSGVYGRDSTVVKGTRGNVYKFISVATDSVDNIEEPPGNPLNNPDAVFVFNSTLPVKLLMFTAVKEKETAILKWSTSSEINSSHFVIEHSNNGINYSRLSMVNAAGNSAHQTDYSYTHLLPAKGYNYYRLKMVDRDDKFEYTPVRVVKFDKFNWLTVMPNPAKNNVIITVPERGGILRLVNSTGIILKQVEMTNNNLAIDLTAFAPGMYFITYTTEANRKLSEKLLIRKGF